MGHVQRPGGEQCGGLPGQRALQRGEDEPGVGVGAVQDDPVGGLADEGDGGGDVVVRARDVDDGGGRHTAVVVPGQIQGQRRRCAGEDDGARARLGGHEGHPGVDGGTQQRPQRRTELVEVHGLLAVGVRRGPVRLVQRVQ
ncbi:MAG: hypothetical protein ACOC84_02250, partial [Actinomycetota bacterium]